MGKSAEASGGTIKYHEFTLSREGDKRRDILEFLNSGIEIISINEYPSQISHNEEMVGQYYEKVLKVVIYYRRE